MNYRRSKEVAPQLKITKKIKRSFLFADKWMAALPGAF
jgi:hypothetical protein